MYRLKISTVPIPKIYVCESERDVKDARHHGIPYIVKPRGWSDEKLVKACLFRFLQRRFPDIKWEEVLHMRKRDIEVHNPVKHVSSEHRENPGYDTCGFSDDTLEVSDGYRMTGGGLDEDDLFDVAGYEDQNIDDIVGEVLDHYVNVEQLQSLKVLPVFLDDISAAVKRNLMNLSWMDGYNKKLGYCAGTYAGSDQAPNLIILDTSSSVPAGVATTMVSLIETLRSQANADLIITTGRSVYYQANQPMPSPDQLRHLIGGCNECRQFYGILREHVLGRHWGNLVVFGDNDAPEAGRFRKDNDVWLKDSELANTKVDRILAFHTHSRLMPGYGLWAARCSPNAEVVYNTEWTNCMDTRRRWYQ